MSSNIPRLEMSDLTPELQAALGPRVARLGYLGEFFRCGGNQPEVLLKFQEFTEALKRALPDRLTEVVALTVAVRVRNDYERHQHQRLAEKLGFGREWIIAVERGASGEHVSLDEAEAAVQRLALALVERSDDAPELLEKVIASTTPEIAVAVLFLVGRYLTHAGMVTTLRLEPPVPSIFADQP